MTHSIIKFRLVTILTSMGNFENRVKEVLSWIDNRVEVLRVGQVDQNNITVVIASQDEDVSLTANTPETIPFNNTEVDLLGEFSNGTFTPTKTGLYTIEIRMEFAVNSDQDELKIDVIDEDASDSILENELRASGTGNRDMSLDSMIRLDAGTGYHIEAENSDNDDTINGKPKRTRLVIKWEGVDPTALP